MKITNLFSGRLSRRSYIIGLFCVYAVTILLGIVIKMVMDSGVPVIGVLMYYVVLIASIVLPISLLIRRLHDVGKSGWFGLLLLVPIVNLYVIYLLLIKTGDAGNNTYGAPPSNAKFPKEILGLT